MDGLTDVPEQLSRSSDRAEPSHAVQIYPEPEPEPEHTLTIWLDQKQREERAKPKKGTIHRVPDVLQANLSCNLSYQPKVVSIGPYHSGEDKLSKFQALKRSMAERLVPGKEREASLRAQVRNKIESLMAAYSSSRTMTPVEWEDMLFLDGCFVLHFIFCITHKRVEDLKIERYDINSVHNDLFLAENQLPFELLQILSGNDPKLLGLIDDYICIHKISKDIDSDGIVRPDKPLHLLDRLRTLIMGPTEPRQGQSKSPPERKRTVLLHAKELTAKGIHLKPNRTGFLKDVSFGSRFIYGTLRLPKIIVDESTRSLFLNLAAYELCADVDSAITSYICFLDSLVNRADDIKELQSTGVLVNHLATEEMAANLFNEMSQGLHPDEDHYMDVKKRIQRFLDHKTEASIAAWVAEGYQNHFRSPLTAMAVLAACLSLGLTATQTYFAIHHSGI